MADNYLEKKMEEYKSKPWSSSGTKGHKPATTLNKLLTKNRPHLTFDNKVVVREEHLKSISEVCNKIEFLGEIKAENFNFEYILPNCNRITDSENQPFTNLCSYTLRETNANAHIIVSAVTNTDNYALTLLNFGILLQSMLLRATEMGFNGTIISISESTNENNSHSRQIKIAIGKGVL